MKIELTDGGTFADVRRKMNALPPGLQSDVYGDGFISAARKARLKSKRLAPVGRGPALTRRGAPRPRLRDTIRAVRVSWRWGGEKVKNSAAIVVASSPHAHLVERGTVRMRARPFLIPPLKDSSGILSAYRAGCQRSFGRLVKRLESGKLRARERRAFR